MWPSSQRRSGSWPFFFWPCCLSPSSGVGSASAAWQVLPFTWAFHVWFSPHGRLASCSSGSLLSRFERLVSLQGASDSMTHFSHEGVVVFSGSGIAVRALLLATSLPLTMVLPLTPGRFVRLCLFRMVTVLKVLVLKCQVLPFTWALTLLAFCLGLRGSCPVVTLQGCLSGSSGPGGARWSSSGHPAGVFSV